MARNGYKIFDADTHVGPRMQVLDAYLTDAERKKLPAWEEYKSVDTVMGWDLPEARKRKLLWDNAVNFYARSGLK